jgi:hypothetical protein
MVKIAASKKPPKPKNPPIDFNNWNAPTKGSSAPSGPRRSLDDPAVKQPLTPDFANWNAPLTPLIPPRGHAQSGLAKNQQSSKSMTFQDYLDLAGKLGLGSNGVDYSGEQAALTNQAGAADSQLAAMYAALKNSYAKDAPGIAANYDSAGQSITGNGDQAAQQISAAYQAARDAQTQQLQALGIQDAVGSLGGRAASDQAQAVSNVRQNQGANLQQNTQNKTAAGQYNIGIQEASQLAGAEQRAKIQQQLAAGLANLDAQQAQAGAQGNQNLLSGAFNLASHASLVDPNAPVNAKDSLSAQLLASQVTGQQLKNQALAANSGATSPNLSQIMALASKNGVTISNADDLNKFVAALKSSGQFG